MERILVSTFQRVVLWDGKQHVVLEGHSHPKYQWYYGITWNEKHIFVAEGGWVDHSVYHVFDKSLNRIGSLPIGADIAGPHQIFWWDGKLYIASAHRDTVVIWDGETCRYVKWGDPNGPRKHTNSIWCDGERFYVVEHRFRTLPKFIQVFDLDFEPVERFALTVRGFADKPVRGLHCVYIEDGILYACSPKVVVRYNLVTKKVKRPIRLPGVAREAHRMHGLARVPGRWFIGLSRVATRKERAKGDGAFMVLDNDFRILDVIWLKSAGGVNDIRAIDGPDLAHNQIACPYV